VNDSRERQFSVTDGQQTYVVHATQTHRAQPHSTEPKLEWQFYIEALNLILIQHGKQYRSIDDPTRVFKVTANARGTADVEQDREAC
jgi:hypothetical protein